MQREKMKILQVFGSLDMGGAESRMMDVYRCLDKDLVSFDFVSLSMADNQYYEAEIQSLGGTIIKMPSPREEGVARHIKRIREILRNGGYQAVHAHTSYHCGLVMRAAKKEGIPIRVAHARTNGTKSKNILKRLYVAYGRHLVKKYATERLAISQTAGKFLFGKSNFNVVPNAIMVEKYQGNAWHRNCIRKELGLGENAFVIAQIGRFESMKNHAFTVEWFGEYCKKNEKARLLFVGDGKLRKSMEDKTQSLGIEDRVHFLGVRGDVPILLSVVDVLFFPSKFEGLGGVVLEAQAASVPVVESDSIPEETDLNLGLVQKVSLDSDFSAWDIAVEKTKTIEKLTEEEINKAFLKNGYSINAVTQKYINIYEGKKE